MKRNRPSQTFVRRPPPCSKSTSPIVFRIVTAMIALTLAAAFTFSIQAASAGSKSAPGGTGTGTHKIRVMIDPGHGGEDDGAVQNGVKEKNITLQVGLEVKRLLAQDPNFVPLLTRDRDFFIPVAERPEKATAEKADVFVSIHANSSPLSEAKGTEFYFENQVPTDEESMLIASRENSSKDAKKDSDPGKSDLANILTDLAHNEHMVLSQQLSQHLLDSFQRELQIKTRAIRQAPFKVLEVNIPSTLIELGFVTNPTEAKWLASSASQKQMAHAIYRGLKAFKEKLDKVRSSPVK